MNKIFIIVVVFYIISSVASAVMQFNAIRDTQYRVRCLEMGRVFTPPKFCMNK